MDAYVLFRRAAGMMMVAPPRAAAYDEQDEDIGSASDSECTSRSSASAASSSSDLADDASSSSSSSSSSSGDHFEMSALMTQLPIKRGLSMFFDGKSQSFASLAAVGGLADLAKPPGKRIRTSRSCEVGLQDAHRGRFARHNAATFKKVSKGRRLSVLGGAPALRPLTASAARPKGLPVRAPLFV